MTMHRAAKLWLALGALSGSTTGGTTDSGTDTGVDTGTDTGTDPGGEGGGVLTVACWDGSTASTAVSCPPLEGEDAVVWVVGSTGAGDAVADCVELLAEPNRGEEEVWQCDTEDMTVLLTRWSSPALAAAYFSNDYATVLPLTSEDGTNGTEWQDCLYDTITCIAWAYDDRPFSQEVFGPNSELVADVYDRLSAKDGTTIDASAP